MRGLGNASASARGIGSDTGAKEPQPSSLVATLLTAVILMTTAGFLIVQNRALKLEMATVRARANMALAVGEELPDVRLTNSRGDVTTLRQLSSSPTALAFLTTTCPFCQESLPTWIELAEVLPKQGSRLVAISFDSPELTVQWAARRGVLFEIWYPATDDDVLASGVGAVPLTVVARDGRVDMALPGSLRAREVAPAILRMLVP